MKLRRIALPLDVWGRLAPLGCIVFCLSASLAAGQGTATPPREPVELAEVRAAREKEVAERITGPYEAGLTELAGKFTTALERAAGEAKKAGKLDEVLALEDDKRRLVEKAPIPDDTAETPETLKKLRAIYRGQLARVAEQRSKNEAAVLPPQMARLQALEVTLTKADRITDAKAVRDYRLSLANPAVAKADAPPASPPPATPSTAGGPGKPMPPASVGGDPEKKKTAGVKSPAGDDRRASEWLLQVGGTFGILHKDKIMRPGKPEELPKSPFVIVDVSLDGRKVTGEITGEGLARLRGLSKLKAFSVNEVSVGDTDLAFLGTCESLETVNFGRNATLTDATFAGLSTLKKLKRIGMWGPGHKEVTGLPLLEWASEKGITSLDFQGTGITDEVTAGLARFPSLESLNLEACGKLTDATLRALAKAPALRRLSFGDTSLTPEALVATELKLTHLGYGPMAGKPVAETAAAIGPAFPSVESIRITSSSRMTSADFAALAHFENLRMLTVLSLNDSSALAGLVDAPQVEELTIERKPFSDGDVAVLLGVPQLVLGVQQLVALRLDDSSLTDEGLLQLAGLPKLKTLRVKGKEITDEGWAAFRKMRRDVKVEK